MASQQFARLLTYLEDLSEPGIDVQSQWVGESYARAHEKGTTCRCGQQHIRYLFSLKNKHNGNTASPIGSQCVLRFADTDLIDWAKDKIKQTQKEERDTKRMQQVEQAACIACRVSDCQEYGNDVRHQYCDTHHAKCTAIARFKLNFGKHKDLSWREAVKTEPSYCHWALGARYNTQPGDAHHDRNKLVGAYIANELAYLNQV